MMAVLSDPIPCTVCNCAECQCDNPEHWRKQEAEANYVRFEGLIREATRSDEYAYLAGEPATALLALQDALARALNTVIALGSHEHEWNGNDYCTVCGADGRA